MTTDKVTGTFEDRPHKELGVTRTVKAFRETAMTTDLSNETVEELRNEVAVRLDAYGQNALHAFDELARRLEEAQQQLELYAAEMSSAREAGFYSAQELWSAYQTAQQRNAAHDAKVAAEAKAEALEEAIERLWERVGREEYGHAKAAVTLDIEAIMELAAEYRAKATEAWRKE